MIFEKLDEKYIEDAVKLAQTQYNMENRYSDALIENDYKDILTNYISKIFKKDNGLVLIDNDKLVGYLSFDSEIENHFGNVKGSYSPLFANGVISNDRGKLMSLMFQYASREMIKDFICSYAITVYSHDLEVNKSLALNGFGIRCSDAIRNVNKPIDVIVNTNYTYEECHYTKAEYLLPLKNKLVKHLRDSPTFLSCDEFTEKDFINLCNCNKSRFFVAKDGDEIIGYMEITSNGETFISENIDMVNICGAYLKVEYRSENVFQSLLKFVLKILDDEGVKRLGVDCETMNPTALRFWNKYFDNYTYSYVRRIDERILNYMG